MRYDSGRSQFARAFGATFVDSDGERREPVMIHRALFGSVERFCGILIEHFAGRLPFWLSPTQIVIASITDEANEYAQLVKDDCFRQGYGPSSI